MNTVNSFEGAESELFRTLSVRKEGVVLLTEAAAPPVPRILSMYEALIA
jgi:hypothetical protein